MPKRLKNQPAEPSPEQVKAILSAHMAAIGAKGGKVSGAKRMQMPKEQRRKIAQKAAQARWGKKK